MVKFLRMAAGKWTRTRWRLAQLFFGQSLVIVFDQLLVLRQEVLDRDVLHLTSHLVGQVAPDLLHQFVEIFGVFGVGLAGLIRAVADNKVALGLDSRSRVLVINTEGATDPHRYAELVGISPADVLAGKLLAGALS